MNTNRFSYQLLRYIPDLNRMEPRNFGIILQGAGETKYRLNTRFAQKGFVDTEAFRIWKQFIQQEFSDDNPEQFDMFRPAQNTPEFLEHLQALFKGNFNLSKIYTIEYKYDIEIEILLSDLYNRLVAEPEEQEALAITRPTGKFRADSEEKNFIKRGLRENAHLDIIGSSEAWIGYRIYENGVINVIEKVEFNRDLRRTAQELNSLIRFVPSIPSGFLSKGNMFHLLIDPHKKFANQTEEEANRYMQDREELINRAIDKNLKVYKSAEETQTLIERIDQQLPQLQV